MINDYLFEMSDSDLNRFDMIYDCHFEMNAKILVTRFILVIKYRKKHVFLKRKWNFPKLYM